MRRDGLDRTMKQIKIRAPWIRWRRCEGCNTDFKNHTPWGSEKMWRINGNSGEIKWGCLRCLPNMGAVLRKHASSNMYRQYEARMNLAGPLDFK